MRGSNHQYHWFRDYTRFCRFLLELHLPGNGRINIINAQKLIVIVSESLEDETFENGPNWNNTSTDNGSRSPTSTPGAHSSSKKARKARTIFTDKQLQELETMFDKHKYLSVQDRMELAQRMGLTDTQVKTWYQNRR